MRTMKKIIKFVKIILLMIISGCNTTVINKQELKNENMKTEEIIKLIDIKIKVRQDYQKWIEENDIQSNISNKCILEELIEIKKEIENYEKERR